MSKPGRGRPRSLAPLRGEAEIAESVEHSPSAMQPRIPGAIYTPTGEVPAVGPPQHRPSSYSQSSTVAVEVEQRGVKIPYKFTLADLNLRSYCLVLGEEDAPADEDLIARLRDHLRKAVVLANVEVCMVRNEQLWQKEQDREIVPTATAIAAVLGPSARGHDSVPNPSSGPGVTNSSCRYVLDLEEPQPMERMEPSAEGQRIEDNRKALGPIRGLLAGNGGSERCSRRRIVSLLRQECGAALHLLGQCRGGSLEADRQTLADLAFTFSAYQPAALDEEIKGSQSPYDRRSKTIEEVESLVSKSLPHAEAKGPQLLTDLAVKLAETVSAEWRSRMEGMMLQAACMCGLSELVDKLLGSRSSEVTETDVIRKLINAWRGYRVGNPLPSELRARQQPQTLDWLDFKCSIARAVLIAHKVIKTVIIRDDRGLTESLQMSQVQPGAFLAMARAADSEAVDGGAAQPSMPTQGQDQRHGPHPRVQFINGVAGGNGNSLSLAGMLPLMRGMMRMPTLVPARTTLGAVLLNDARPAELEPQRWVPLKKLFPRAAACKPLALAIMHVVLAGKEEVRDLRREVKKRQQLEQQRRWRRGGSDSGAPPLSPGGPEAEAGEAGAADEAGSGGQGRRQGFDSDGEDDGEDRGEGGRHGRAKEAQGALYHKLHLLAVQAAHLAVHSISLSTVSDALRCVREVRAWPAIELEMLVDLAEHFPLQCGALLEDIPLISVDLEDNVLPFGLPPGFITVAVSDKDSKEFGQDGQGGGSTQDAEHFATQREEDVTIEASLLVQARAWLALLFLFWPSEWRSPATRKLARVLRCAVAAFLCQGPGSWLVAIVSGLVLAALAVLSRLVVAVFRILYWGVMRRIWTTCVERFPMLGDVTRRVCGVQGIAAGAGTGLNASMPRATSTRYAPRNIGRSRCDTTAREEQGIADGTRRHLNGNGGGRQGPGGGGEGERASGSHSDSGSDSDGESDWIDVAELKRRLLGGGLWHQFFAHGHNSVIDAAVGWGRGSATISCRKVPFLLSYGHHDTPKQQRNATGQAQGPRRAMQVRERQLDTSLLEKLLKAPGLHPSVFGTRVLRAIILFKWNYFTKYFIILQLLLHLTYMGVFLAYAFTIKDMAPVDGRSSGPGSKQSGCQLEAPTRLQTALLSLLAIMTVDFTIQEIRQIRHFGLMFLTQAWDVLDICSVTLVIASILLHVSCTSNVSPLVLRGLAAVQIVLLFMRLLYYGMASDKLGAFVRMVLETTYDLLMFFAFLSIVFVGFALAIIISQGALADEEATFIKLFTMMYGDFDADFLSQLDSGALGLDTVTRILVSLYMIMVTIILLNLLISIISESYERIRENERWESLRNKAVLVVESETQLYQSFLTWLYTKLTPPSAAGAADGGQGRGGQGQARDGQPRHYLYVIAPENARRAQAGADDNDDAGSDDDEDEEDEDDEDANGQWIGRLGEMKRHISAQGRSTLDGMRKEVEGVRKELGKVVQKLEEQQGYAVSQLQPAADGVDGGAAEGQDGAAATVPAPRGVCSSLDVRAAVPSPTQVEQLDQRTVQLITTELGALMAGQIDMLRRELLDKLERTVAGAAVQAAGRNSPPEPLGRPVPLPASTPGDGAVSVRADAVSWQPELAGASAAVEESIPTDDRQPAPAVAPAPAPAPAPVPAAQRKTAAATKKSAPAPTGST